MLMSLSVSGCQLLISFNGVAEMSTQCSDGIDNDQNGFMDCADPSCAGSEQCGGGRDGGSPVDASSTMDGFTRDGSLQDGGVADGASGNTSVVQSLTGPNGIVCTTVGSYGNDRKVAAASDRSQYVVMLCGPTLYVAAAPAPTGGINVPILPFRAPVELPRVSATQFSDAEIAVGANGLVHVAAIGQFNIQDVGPVVYYYQSIDGGLNWSAGRRISQTTESMSMDAIDDVVVIAVARTNQAAEIYLKQGAADFTGRVIGPKVYSDISVRFDQQSRRAYTIGVVNSLGIEVGSEDNAGALSQIGFLIPSKNPALSIDAGGLLWVDDVAPDVSRIPLPVQANSSAALNFGLPSPGQGEHRSMSSLADGTVAVAQVEASQRLVLHHRFVSGMKSSSVVADVGAASPSVVAIPGTQGGSTIVWTQGGIIRTLSSLTP
jgi:hypothetical protein